MQHTKVVSHCVGPLRATVMITAAERFDAWLWKSEGTSKCHLLENREILECPANKLGTIGEGRKHLTVFEGVVASCHLYSSC